MSKVVRKADKRLVRTGTKLAHTGTLRSTVLGFVPAGRGAMHSAVVAKTHKAGIKYPAQKIHKLILSGVLRYAKSA